MKTKTITLLLLCFFTQCLWAQVAKVAYWIDGNADSFYLQDTTGSSVALQADAAELPIGVHTLTFRVADTNGIWSAPRSYFFIRTAPYQQSATRYEYWIDGSSEQRISDALTGNTIQTNLDMAEIANGLHCLTFRTLDTHAVWSAPRTYFFIKTPPPQESDAVYEYWIDGNIEQRMSDSWDGSIINFTFDASTLPEGEHSFSFRVKDKHGIWSAPVTEVFNNLLSGITLFSKDDSSISLHTTTNNISISGANGAKYHAYSSEGRLLTKGTIGADGNLPLNYQGIVILSISMPDGRTIVFKTILP